MAGRIYLSVGSNLGNKKENCRNGITALCEKGDFRLLAQSPWYLTEPVDFKEQGWFVNAALEIATEQSPEALLDRIEAVQKKLGRKRGEIRFGPRTIDLDILFFRDRIIETERLTVPHPRLHLRRFVLQPLCDLAPEWTHPLLKKDIAALCRDLPPDEQRIYRLP